MFPRSSFIKSQNETRFGEGNPQECNYRGSRQAEASQECCNNGGKLEINYHLMTGDSGKFTPKHRELLQRARRSSRSSRSRRSSRTGRWTREAARQ